MDFLFRNLTNKNIYDNFEKLKTEKGKQRKLRESIYVLMQFPSWRTRKRNNEMKDTENLCFIKVSARLQVPS